MMTDRNQIVLELEKWRGYSAYEVAVANGFTGTQKEWLESLKGGVLQITVCGKNVDSSGNIVLYATDIKMEEGALHTIASKIASLEQGKLNAADIVNDLDSDDPSKPLSAAQGLVLKRMILEKAEMFLAEIELPVEGWQGDGPYTLDVAVEGITDASGVVLGCYPDGAENEEEFADTECRLVSRAEGEITIRVASLPRKAFKANLMVVIPGVKNE